MTYDAARVARIMARMAGDPEAVKGISEIARRRNERRLEAARRAADSPEDSPLKVTLQVSSLRIPEDEAMRPRAGAPVQRHLMTPLRGRLVRAEEANLNGTYFALDDLQWGLSSLPLAPLTYNHETAMGAVGLVTDAEILTTPENGPHIEIASLAWTSRFPHIHDSIQESIKSGTASMSMECLAEEVHCRAEDCGFIYTEDLGDEACDHILNRTAARRMARPTFYGAGLILDGVKPGWPGASLRVEE